VKTFSQRVRLARMACGWTQKELASASGLTQSAIGNYESGQRNQPPGDALLRLAEALSVTPLWLSQGGGPMDISDAGTQAPAKPSKNTSANGGGENSGMWPFEGVGYDSYRRLSSNNKQLLESLVSTFIDSCSQRSKS
jgi:transcriptional regulator with XRE-family HTH domain